MPKLRWTGGTFTDGRRGFRTTGGVHDFQDEDRVEEYLNHRSGNWERTEEGADESSGDDFDAEAFLDRTPVSDVADDIKSGVADSHLDEVEAAADRVTVERAIEARREG
jgi:hypothetical protein